MRGQMLGVDSIRQTGVLSGADGERLEFPLSEWRSPGAPAAGQWVDYVLADGQARQVYAAPAAPVAASAAPAATPGGTVFGAIAVGCLVLGFVFPILPTIAAFVFGVVGAGRAKAEHDNTGLILSRIGWIGALVLMILGLLFIAMAILFFGGLMNVLQTNGWTWQTLSSLKDFI